MSKEPIKDRLLNKEKQEEEKKEEDAGYTDQDIKDEKNETRKYLMQCVKDKKNIDIYQFLAIYGGVFKDLDEDQYSIKDRVENVIKAIMCIFVQIAGVTLILYEFVNDNNRDICNTVWTFKDIIYKLLALCLCARLSYEGLIFLFIWKGIHRFQNYPNSKHFAAFFAWTGFIINKLIAVAVIGGGFLIIFYADSAYRIILSGLALKSLLDLDDQLLHDAHYKLLKHKIDEDVKKQQYKFDSEECNLLEVEPHGNWPPIYWLFVGVCCIASIFVGICW